MHISVLLPCGYTKRYIQYKQTKDCHAGLMRHPHCSILIYTYASSEPTSLVPVAAHFRTSGILGDAFFNQNGSNVNVDFRGRGITSFNDSAQWQIHELPVDSSIHPKFRCTPKFVGLLMYSGGDGQQIYNVTATSLVMHSIVLLIAETVVSCGTIHLESSHSISATAKFRSGVFGRLDILEFPGKYS